MTAEGHKVASLHGAKDATERDTIIDAFRQGKDKVSIIYALHESGFMNISRSSSRPTS
jgi:superfamily II DNA or RNA helicase